MKRIYNIVTVFLLALILLFVSGCKKQNHLKIGFLYSSDITIRFKKEGNFFKNYAEKEGVEVTVMCASNDEAKQLDQAREMIDNGVDVLVVIAVNVNTAAAIVREAHNNDVPVMAYNRMIQNSDVDFFVASSNDQIGKLMVDAVMDEKKGGNFVLLGGDKFDKNGLDLQKAIKKYLNPYIDNGNVNLIYEAYIEQWDGDIAGFEMQKIISSYGTDIDAVISGFDGMSDGIIKVLKKYDLNGKVAVTGQDANVSGCKNIIAGDQIVTVFHPLNKIAEKGAQIAIEMAKGNSVKDFANSTELSGDNEIPTHRVNSIAITKDNLEKELINTGFYKREDLY